MEFKYEIKPQKDNSEPPVVYTIQELADVLKTSRRTATQLVKSGLIHAIKIGSTKVPAKEVDRFLEANVGKDLTDPYNVVDL